MPPWPRRSSRLLPARPPLPRCEWRTTAGAAAIRTWVALVDTEDGQWRNRAEFLVGRKQIVAFLTRKWVRELNYRLIKEIRAFSEDRIAVRFAYEYHDGSGNWFRAYGNGNWEFNAAGLMQRRFASINDMPI